MQTHVVTNGVDRLPQLDSAQVLEVADILRVMGDPTRLRVLLACLDDPAPVGELAARIDLPRSLVSHHLRMLRSSRLLRATRDGKQVIYSATDHRVRCIVRDLAHHVLADDNEDD